MMFFFFNQQEAVRYNLMGFRPGTDYFFLDGATGTIYVKDSLYRDPAKSLTYTVNNQSYKP